MNKFVKILSRVLITSIVVSITYLEPKVFAVQSTSTQVRSTNNMTMSNKNFDNLDIVTINFLNAIEDSSSLYDSKQFSTMEEIIVRIRLQDTFADYFSLLKALESQEGLEMTQRSREVVQEAIAEFMATDKSFMQTLDLAKDLDEYSRALTESMISLAVAA